MVGQLKIMRNIMKVRSPRRKMKQIRKTQNLKNDGHESWLKIALGKAPLILKLIGFII